MRNLENKLVNKIKNELQNDKNNNLFNNNNTFNKLLKKNDSKKHLKIKREKLPILDFSLSILESQPKIQSTPLNFATLIGLDNEISGISYITAPKHLNINQKIDKNNFLFDEAEPSVVRLNRYGGYALNDFNSNRNSIGLSNDQLISEYLEENFNDEKITKNNLNFNYELNNYDLNSLNSEKNISNNQKDFENKISNQKIDKSIIENQLISDSIQNSDYYTMPVLNEKTEKENDKSIKKSVTENKLTNEEILIVEELNKKKSTNSFDDEKNNLLKSVSNNKKIKNKTKGSIISKILNLSTNDSIESPAKQKHQSDFHLQIEPKSTQSLNELEYNSTDIIPWWKNINNKTENSLSIFNTLSKSEPHIYRCLNNLKVIEFLQCRIKETKYVTAVFESANKGLSPILVDIEQEFKHWLGPNSLLLAVACEVHWSVPERYRSRIVEIK